jgi:hypothetical protein
MEKMRKLVSRGFRGMRGSWQYKWWQKEKRVESGHILTKFASFSKCPTFQDRLHNIVKWKKNISTLCICYPLILMTFMI